MWVSSRIYIYQKRTLHTIFRTAFTSLDQLEQDTYHKFRSSIHAIIDKNLDSCHYSIWGNTTGSEFFQAQGSVVVWRCGKRVFTVLLSAAAHYRSPYCRLGILNMNHLESTGSEFKFLSEWQKTGAVSEVVTTSSNPTTMEPVWNEDVKLWVLCAWVLFRPMACHLLSCLMWCIQISWKHRRGPIGDWALVNVDLYVTDICSTNGCAMFAFRDDVQQDKRKNLKALMYIVQPCSYSMLLNWYSNGPIKISFLCLRVGLVTCCHLKIFIV